VEKAGRFELKTGDCILLPPLFRHRYESREGFQDFSFKFDVAPTCWPLFRDRCCTFQLDISMRQRVRSAFVSHVADAPLELQEVRAIISLCLVDALNASGGANVTAKQMAPMRKNLWPLLDRVLRDPFARWTVAAMAAECNLSADHFSKCFHALFAKTPHQFLLGVRIRAAALELDTVSGSSIKEVAELANYTSVHAFTRAFKRVMGVSPGSHQRVPRG
jgi:AraC-like DNA-binding protein